MKNSAINSLTLCLVTTLLNLITTDAFSQIKASLVDFDGYEHLITEVKEHRKTHLINAKEFVATSKEEKVIVLDTRSDSMYAAAHVKGAVHLNFSDFTQDNLAKIIPSPDYKILIYCNNNFESKPLAGTITALNLERYFVTKVALPVNLDTTLFKKQKVQKNRKEIEKGPKASFTEEVNITEKPLTLALNIPTYINLYGYGYRNIYELSELVNTNSGQIEFEGTAVAAGNNK